MSRGFNIHVSAIGLDEMREYPELVPACGELLRTRGKLTPGWASVHVSMNILMFLIKLNFR
jgi:hypothetical protein